jgi:tRNA pseudouridine55 synthase
MGMVRSGRAHLTMLLSAVMKDEINKLHKDEFGRVHGIIAINKEANMTSHDVVDRVRRALGTRKVGHAGALDPFATGLLIILVGKATKLSDQYLNKGKSYKAKVVFGIRTDSADVEGNIQEVTKAVVPSNISDILASFTPSYDQYVPVFSSVKIEGEKLRVLARKYDQHEIFTRDGERFVRFFRESASKEVKLPKHTVEIDRVILNDKEEIDILSTEFGKKNKDRFLKTSVFPTIDIEVDCSKGTYIRAFAEDIGEKFDTPAMLIELKRTRIGDITIENSVSLEDVSSL